MRIGELSVRIVMPIDMKKLHRLISIAIHNHATRLVTYPNVADEAIIYCPNVRSIPFGPGPNLIMFVAPNMKPIMSPTAINRQSEGVSLRMASHTSTHHSTHLGCMLLAATF